MRQLVLLCFLIAIIGCSQNIAPTKDAKPTSSFEQEVQEERRIQLGNRTDDKAVLNLDELSYFKLNSKYRVTAKFKNANSKGSLNIPTSSGKKKEFYKYGTLFFTLDDQKRQLTVYRNIASMRNPKYKNYLFLPFTDESNGEETYGGGRYIDLRIEDVMQKDVILDFNMAYNPYCAYGDGWNCPIPPVENHISTKILAGEKVFNGVKSKRN